MMRGQTALLPSGPNTKPAPTPPKSSSQLMPRPAAAKASRPGVVRKTMSAMTICRLRPHATVLRSIAARLDDQANAIASRTSNPVSDWTLGALATAAMPAAMAAPPSSAPRTTKSALRQGARAGAGADG